MNPQVINKNLYYTSGQQGSGSASFVPGDLTDPSSRKIRTKAELLPAFRDYYTNQFYAPAEAQIKLNQGIDNLQYYDAQGRPSGGVGGYYSRINPQIRQQGYQNWVGAGSIMPGDINENNLLDLVQKTGWSGLDRSQLEQYFSGQALPSEYITNPETGNMQLATQYQEGLKQKADIAAGKQVQIGTAPGGQPLYAPTGSPAQLQTQATQQATQQGQTPQQAQQAGQAAARTTTLPEMQPLVQANPAVPMQAQGIAAEATPQPAGYMGNSVVDYLKSTGQPSDFASRSALAKQIGITGYRGSSSQNLDMLNKLRAKPAGISSPTQSQTTGGANTPSPNAGAPVEVVAANTKPEVATVIGQHGFTPEIIQAQSQKSPFNAFVDSYKALYQDMGLSTIKQQYESITKQYKELEDKKNDEITDINDDPWLTEGVRAERVKKVESRYEGKTSNLTRQMKNMESLYDRGQEEVKFIAGQAMQASHQQDVLSQQWSMKAMELAQKDAEASEKHSPAYLEYQDAVDSGYKGTFSQYQTEDANRKISIARAGASGLTPYQESQILNRINENVSKNATYARTTSMRGFADNMQAALSQANGVADIAAINQFQKVIDEGAVTRDQDVKLIQGAQSLANSLKLKITKLQSGDQLSPEQRSQMGAITNSMYDAQVKALQKDPYIASKIIEAKKNGLNVEDTILGQLGGFSSDVKTTPPPFIPDSEMSNYVGQNQSVYTPATVPPLQTNPKGFFDQFLSVFAGN